MKYHKSKNYKNEIGDKFEKFVANIYFNLDKYNIKKNVVLVKKNKKKKVCSEFDVVFGIFSKKYIECKYKLNSKVSANEVAFFAEKLKLHNISTFRGIFITNSYFTNRAISIGKLNKIKLINRKCLQKLEYESFGFFKSIKSKYFQKNKVSLEKRISEF